MSVYKRGNTWWYSFWFAGRFIQETAKTRSKTVAKEAEKNRRRELEEGYNNITPESRKRRVLQLAQAAKEYQADYATRHAANSVSYSKYCIRHLTEHLGSKMLIDITPETVVEYQRIRLKEGAAGKSINEEVGELFRIMGEFGETVRLQLKRSKKLKLPEREDVGLALTAEEEKKILAQAKLSTSGHIYAALVIALNTAMRDSEIRNLTWGQIDMFKQILTVGKSKTAEGAGRTIPMNSELLRTLAERRTWYEATIGKPRPQMHVFPKGRRKPHDPTRPVTSFSKPWDTIRKKTGVKCRFHDLRHTLITKLAESGAGDETIRAIAGHVSRRMLSRYAHIRTEAKRRALESILTPAAPPTAAEETPEEASAMVN